MKTTLYIIFTLLSFSKTNAQSYTAGTPLNLDLITNFEHDLTSINGEDILLYIYIPQNTTTGIQNILIIDNISDISVPSLINNDTIHIGDTIFISTNNENLTYTSSALEQIITYSIKSIGTPQIAFEPYPCGEFSWIMTLPDNEVTINFGYHYENVTCLVNDFNPPAPVDPISFIGNNVIGLLISSSDSTINQSLSIQNINTGSSFLLFPNPTKNNITISGLNKFELNEMKIFNITGDLVLTSNLNEEKTTFDLSNLLNGVYILEIANNDGIIREKIIKE